MTFPSNLTDEEIKSVTAPVSKRLLRVAELAKAISLPVKEGQK